MSTRRGAGGLPPSPVKTRRGLGSTSGSKGSRGAPERWAVRLSIDQGRLPPGKAFSFGTSVRKHTQPRTDVMHDVKFSSLRQTAPKWPTRDTVLQAEQRARHAEEARAVGAMSQYPGKHVFTQFGDNAPKHGLRGKRASATTFQKRPPTGLVSREAQLLNAHHLVDPAKVSTFGEGAMTKSASATLLPRPRDPPVEPVTADKQWPGEVQTSFTIRKGKRCAMDVPRPETFPIPKQTNDIGPGRYEPPSSLDMRGGVMPGFKSGRSRPAEVRRARTAASGATRSARQRKSRPQTAAGLQHLVQPKASMPASLSDWFKTQPEVAASGANGYQSSDSKPAVAEFSSIKDWLAAHGTPAPGSSFSFVATRRASVSRGLSRRGRREGRVSAS